MEEAAALRLILMLPSEKVVTASSRLEFIFCNLV